MQNHYTARQVCLMQRLRHLRHQPTYLITHHPRRTHNQQRIAPNRTN